ncbi:nicotinate-nucleotide adenylyltransferase [Maridesulfovibrio salexigens]|uniref:Probable nicotinate-nucleotide adenylyltransferase n=1 Tax=Maridesulfovibrio salexigens (strain ATCC 14822 / DSM 2638 / NCIMB 8403 / VKM B-1763) TaxID=526222 RepID=NADD_MARSD|nr:nicotinate-nucleotide adenylyltransferase [Maridesulfovibrio salexigens]C6BSC2.1 RecName: Full=Probable nicotinate-nucleotide adenylyltransferase; AltName: Full=Deamido-NAD(+) diphosphorylase; AltName: Full=Deamido-NAD(+) pyrophosphorylase; AltName: Full=Nicotinate mononucleotide adenylyltransferase; Short=NaMN adenylyltransferase [Maridesulfovibrio salexigens DSM 2638]ACS79598.1 nicotinate (nicotinamide) nucleotide adenylyltransferase [Maridesulfovibrio salexigens DSM 2638]
MKIGLFGGSFNPVHLTHLDVANGVLKRLGLDKVLFVPAGNPYHKEQGEMLSAELRYELVKKAVQGCSGLGVSDIDISADGPTYTVDTLREASRRYPDAELYFIMGQDSLETFTTWKGWQSIPELANVVAVSRAEADHGAMSQELKRIFPEVVESGQDVWQMKGGKSIYIIGDFDFVISSTLVREEWKKGRDVSKLVPKAVAECMNEKGDKLKKFWR